MDNNIFPSNQAEQPSVPTEPVVVSQPAHKTFNKTFFIVLVGLLILGLTAGAYLYFQGDNVNNQIASNTEQSLNSEEATNNNNKVAAIVKKDCGTITDEHIGNILFTGNDTEVTVTEKQNAGCMSEAYVKCAAAFQINFRMEENKSVRGEVIGKEGTNCKVSQEDFGGQIRVCNIPMDFIFASLEELRKQNLSAYTYHLTVPFVMLGGKYTDVTTGKETPLDCGTKNFTVDVQVNNSDGPVTIDSKTATFFWLHWETGLGAKSCSASGSWSGPQSTYGDRSLGAEANTQPINDLLQYFSDKGFKPVDTQAGKYNFALTCVPESGQPASDEVIVYVK